MNKKLTELADISTNLLAIVGGIGLIYAAVSLPERIFDGFPEPEILVTPFCVPALNSEHRYEDGVKAPMELRGFRIETKSDISNIKFRVDSQDYIAAWYASSNGMANEDLIDLVGKQLPRGSQKYQPIYGNIPRLMANTNVVIQFSAVADNKFDCTTNWFTVSVPEKKVFHRMLESTYPIRELSFKSPPIEFYKWLFLILFLANIGYILLRRRRMLSGRRNDKGSRL